MTDPITRLNSSLEGRYRVEREIGAGGMATVYLADDLRHERKVALKVLKPELAALVGGERFLAEIKTTANLQHPHILPLFDSGEADGFLFFVMPYVQGETLRARINREKQLPVDEAVSIATKVAGALQHAHEQGVIHRDVKPGNILLRDGEPVVADFGISLAVAQAGGGRVTETGLSLGTPHYMSPEQATGDHDVDPRTDVYALGCVLYEMLTGQPPYTGASAQSVLAQILTEQAPAPKRARAAIPTNVDAAIRKALEKLPADRFATPRDFAQALANPAFRHGDESAADAVHEGRRRGQWTPVAIAATAVAAVLALALGWAVRGRDAPEAPIRFDFSLEGQAVGGGGDWGADLTISPDGSEIAYAGGANGPIWRRPLGELDPIAIPRTTGAHIPRYSPDGDALAFVMDGRLLTMPSSGGAALTLVQGSVQLFGLSWGRDGMLYYSSEDGLWRVPATGGEAERLTSFEDGVHLWPYVLPNGRGLLFTAVTGASLGYEISLLSFDTGEARVLFPGTMVAFAGPRHIVYTLDDGTLMAVPFDEEQLEVTGAARSLLQGVQLNPIGGALCALSDNGVLVYGVSSGGGDLRLEVASFAGGAESLPVTAPNLTDPRWSPSGSSVAYSSGPRGGENIYVLDLARGSAPRQLTFEGSNIDPVWSPDGSALAFASTREGTLDYDLFVKSVDTDAPEEQILESESPQFPRQWITGDLIVFENGAPASSDFWYVPAHAGAEATPYLQAAEDLDDIAVSPDGRWAAYQSSAGGVEAVYARSFPEPRQPTRVSQQGGQFPRWAPDGSAIYYWSAEGMAVDTLYAASVLTEPTFEVVSRRVVHTGNYAEEDWDLHPDGDRIIGAQTLYASDRTDHLVVVLNFFWELERVAPDP